ncbi:unannotated protein [freshwater metagenome]|uniref:Unannotated protein n=1 Tax=freshwater metagenome TaxID=449393 RepID=A0A6J7KJ88_9ZZZZ
MPSWSVTRPLLQTFRHVLHPRPQNCINATVVVTRYANNRAGQRIRRLVLGQETDEERLDGDIDARVALRALLAMPL